MRTLRVDLDWDESRYAVGIGRMRDKHAKQQAAQPAGGQDPEETHEKNIIGALAEGAAHKAADMFWRPHLGDSDAPDMGEWEVRGTDLPGGGLLVRRRDLRKAERVFICVRLLDWDAAKETASAFDIAGWAYGHEVMVPEYEFSKNGRPPCWIKPARLLRPLESLKLPPREGWQGEWVE